MIFYEKGMSHHMVLTNRNINIFSMLDIFTQGLGYLTDFFQRVFLYTDVMRKRGNNYLDHIQKDQPPVLVFDYEMVLDGRTFERPVNYSLVRILDRRKKNENQIGTDGDANKGQSKRLQERRVTKAPRTVYDSRRRPIVVIDPRAGHGPGIGGSKLNSQIGVALNFGHPVYFILFYTEPEPGQTIYDVQQAEIRFLEEVCKRHPDADKPAVIGNCQAGWAAALIGADRPDIVGPMVFNGSPLSYWGGVEGASPMRYRGGLVGGVWLTSLWCDLGNGKFDGAHLVANFEDLNPSNTLWTKQYNLWRNVDTEENRYLDFEKWWGGFFKMNREEIHFIVSSLFVGNELEHGFLKLHHGKTINLKNFKEPIVVFASKGDNITPPQQALNWIIKVYGTVDEIKRNGQVIVYLLHERIGHLGIFVSGSIASKEHTEILNSVRMIDYLAPGLYEMIIREDPSKPWLNDYKVEFVERDIEDIKRLDDGLEDEYVFQPVAAISRFNDKLYQVFLSPIIRSLINPITAEWIAQLHPLRVQRYLISDLNPFIIPVKYIAEYMRKNRQPVDNNNIFVKLELVCSEAIKTLLDMYRDFRDSIYEQLFKWIYNNSWMQVLFCNQNGLSTEDLPKRSLKRSLKDDVLDKELWRQAMMKGSFAEGVVRIIIFIMGVNRIWARNKFGITGKIFKVNERLKSITPEVLRQMIKHQAMLIHTDKDMAIETLTHLLPTHDDRVEALEIATSIAAGDLDIDEKEKMLLDRLKEVLKV